MYTIYYGTNNAQKINFMKNRLKDLPINIIGINEIKNIDHNINEIGKEPLENAKIKAWHYYMQINKPVFSADSGLFFDNVEYKDQPGTNIRRINGLRLNDNEMINYYSNLAKKYGGEIIGYYRNGICIIINEKIVMEMDTENLNSEKFIITERPHQKIIEGFPLDSLSKEIKTGKYYYDIEEIKYNKKTDEEYKKLFMEIIRKMEMEN
jgi:8-oxo-dGTP diphosphatase